MVTGLGTAAAAMDAQSERLAVLANNLANQATAGFKADHLEFFQLLTSPRAAGLVSPTDPAAPPSPITSMSTHVDFSPGVLHQTGNALDLAIDGSGFFVVDAPSGPRLTRAGAFVRTATGLLTAPDGSPVLDGRRQPIRLPNTGTIDVAADGSITVDGVPTAQLLVVDPPNPETLARDGGTRFVPPQQYDFAPFRGASVRHGALELSNVNPVLSLVEMIDALRIYEAAQHAARGIDETLGRAVNDVSRV